MTPGETQTQSPSGGVADARWVAVDRYLDEKLAASDPALEAALADSAAAGLPAIQITAQMGAFLRLLARTLGARRILEVGTLGGYSTIWLARGLANGGRLVTLEIDPQHAEVARRNLARAGVGDRAEVRLGPALETLPRLAAESGTPFDLVFIDADKPSNPDYLDWAVRLTRPGSWIVIDNVVREGKVADAASRDANVIGVRAALDRIAADPRLEAAALQTVGSKGYDGFLVARVIEPAR